VTGYLTFYDAAWPPDPPPVTDGVCVYIGGDATHVWTLEEIGMQPARYRLPIFVRSNPRGIAGVAADVNAALAQLKAIGAPRGTLCAWDMETAADKLYIAGIYTGMAAHGYRVIIYGSQSSVMGNDVPDDLYWGADWTGAAHLHSGDAMTQWVSFSGYDLDLAESSLPFWDTQAKAPKPPVTKPALPTAPSAPPWQETMLNSLPILSEGAADEPGHVFFVHRAQALVKVYGQITGLPEAAALDVSGTYDAATKTAVGQVQGHARITVDGVVGADTWAVLITGSAS
jgi:peptidoglycan hydrolase-like protein with peptidoglycan-binding domain